MTRPRPQRHHYRIGERVLVEGVVTRFDPLHKPFAEVHVMVPPATDPSGLLDGVEMICPQVVVHSLSGDSVDVSNYLASEGFYDTEGA